MPGGTARTLSGSPTGAMQSCRPVVILLSLLLLSLLSSFFSSSSCRPVAILTWQHVCDVPSMCKLQWFTNRGYAVLQASGCFPPGNVFMLCPSMCTLQRLAHAVDQICLQCMRGCSPALLHCGFWPHSTLVLICCGSRLSFFQLGCLATGKTVVMS